jgi:hypothetical protein
MRYRHSLDLLIAQTDKLQSGVAALIAPLGAELRDTVNAGEEAGKDSASTVDGGQLAHDQERIEGLTIRVKTLSAALIPLQGESMALERSRSNLIEWKASLATQTDEILRVLFLRALGLAVALILLVFISEVWRRATFRYVKDARRRRQLLLVRRFAVPMGPCRRNGRLRRRQHWPPQERPPPPASCAVTTGLSASASFRPAPSSTGLCRADVDRGGKIGHQPGVMALD